MYSFIEHSVYIIVAWMRQNQYACLGVDFWWIWHSSMRSMMPMAWITTTSGLLDFFVCFMYTDTWIARRRTWHETLQGTLKSSACVKWWNLRPTKFSLAKTKQGKGRWIKKSELWKWGFWKKWKEEGNVIEQGIGKKRNAMQQGPKFVSWRWRVWGWRYGTYMICCGIAFALNNHWQGIVCCLCFLSVVQSYSRSQFIDVHIHNRMWYNYPDLTDTITYNFFTHQDSLGVRTHTCIYFNQES